MSMSCDFQCFTDRGTDRTVAVRVAEFDSEGGTRRSWVSLNIGSISILTDNPDLLAEIGKHANRAAQLLRGAEVADKAAKAARQEFDKSIPELLDEMKSIPLS